MRAFGVAAVVLGPMILMAVPDVWLSNEPRYSFVIIAVFSF